MKAIPDTHKRWSHWVPTIERRIIGAAIKVILEQGNSITIWDGEDNAVTRSKNVDHLVEAVAATDVTVFTIISSAEIVLGWLAWIHGNHEDVLSDASAGTYTDELIEAIEKEVGS